MQVTELVDLFCQQLEADGRSAHSIAQVRRHGRLFATWLASENVSDTVAELSPPTVARFLGSHGALVRPDGQRKLVGTMNALRTSLRCLLRFAHDAGYAPQNAARLVRRARCTLPPPRALPPADVERLLATLAAASGRVAARDSALFHLLAGTGLRVGSALALDVEHVDVAAGTLRIETAKGGTRGRVFLNAVLREHLARYIGDRTSGPLFEGRGGGALTARHAQARLGAWLARAGVEQRYSPHALRHAFATQLLMKSGNLALVQAALLHASIDSTIRYARVNEQQLRSALGA